MLFSEFVAGTGCRETDKNYQVYKELEIIYMNTDCSKEHIYEMGKKLVDNSKTEAELQFEAEINEEIRGLKAEIERVKGIVKECDESIRLWKEYGDAEMVKMNQNSKRFWNRELKQYRNKVNELKWVLG